MCCKVGSAWVTMQRIPTMAAWPPFFLATHMNITKDTAVTLNYKIHEILKGGIAGPLLDKGDVAYLHGGYQNIFEKVEAALEGKAVGDTLLFFANYHLCKKWVFQTPGAQKEP